MGNSYSERLPHLPHVTFRCQLELLIAPRHSQVFQHHRRMLKCVNVQQSVEMLVSFYGCKAIFFKSLLCLLTVSLIDMYHILYLTDISPIKVDRTDLITELGYYSIG